MAVLTRALLLLLLAAPAFADTITITSGTITIKQYWNWDICGFGIGSDQFASQNNGGCGVSAPYALLPGLAKGLSGGAITMYATILDGRSYTRTEFNAGNTLFQFSHEPITPTFQRITDENGVTHWTHSDEVIVPFIMTGALNMRDAETLAPVRFDLTGQGMIDVAWENPYAGIYDVETFPFLAVTYTFGSNAAKESVAVPESASVVLLGIGLVLVFVQVIRQGRSDRLRLD